MVELLPPRLDAVFHALGDATRRRMLRELADGERTVGQLAQPFAISLAAASKHIKALENAGPDPARGARAHASVPARPRAARERPRVAELLRALLERPAGCARTAPSRGGRPQHPRPGRRRPMTELATLDPYGVLTEPATLTIERLLPGPIERVWAYLTESDLRRQWLAAGEMEMKVGDAVRAGLAQRRADRPARPASRRLRREHRMAEPDHRARSAPQARLRLERQRRRLVRAGRRRARTSCSP